MKTTKNDTAKIARCPCVQQPSQTCRCVFDNSMERGWMGDRTLSGEKIYVYTNYCIDKECDHAELCQELQDTEQ